MRERFIFIRERAKWPVCIGLIFLGRKCVYHSCTMPVTTNILYTHSPFISPHKAGRAPRKNETEFSCVPLQSLCLSTLSVRRRLRAACVSLFANFARFMFIKQQRPRPPIRTHYLPFPSTAAAPAKVLAQYVVCVCCVHAVLCLRMRVRDFITAAASTSQHDGR